MLYYNDNEYTDQQFTSYLLSEYINKYFTTEQIKNMKSYKPSQIARLLAKKDFSFFCLYYLRDYFVAGDNNFNRNLAPLHLDIWKELTQMFTFDRWDKEEFILPRGSAKSTVINKALSCWQHCYKKSRYTIVLGNKESDAIQFIEDTKQMLKNRSITKEFGNLVDKASGRTVNKQELELTNNTKIQAFSWGSSVRGTTYGCSEGIFRPTVIILDDVLKEDDILSEGAKEKVLNKFYKEVLEVGEKAVFRKNKKIKAASKFLILGTPLAQDDFISSIKQDPSFRVFQRSVCNFDVDKYFLDNEYWQEFKRILFDVNLENSQDDAIEYYNKNYDKMQFETVWEKYNCLDLALTYFTKRLTFMQELMCNCEEVGEQWIDTIVTLSKDKIEDRDFQKTVLSIDPAATNTRKSDYTAFTVLSKSNNLYFVREGLLDKFDSVTEFDLYIDKVINLLYKYPDITHVFVEKNVYKGIDIARIEERIKEDKELSKRKIVVKSIYNTVNKDNRISTITDKINNGQVIFNEECKDYNKQVKDFKGQNYSLHDDAIDSLEMAVNNIDEITVIGKLTVLPYDYLF